MNIVNHERLDFISNVKVFLLKQSHLLNCMGVGLAIISAAVNAANISISPYAWAGYLISSVFLLGWALGARNTPQVLMNLSFFCVNMLGVFRWLILNTNT